MPIFLVTVAKEDQDKQEADGATVHMQGSHIDQPREGTLYSRTSTDNQLPKRSKPSDISPSSAGAEPSGTVPEACVDNSGNDKGDGVAVSGGDEQSSQSDSIGETTCNGWVTRSRFSWYSSLGETIRKKPEYQIDESEEAKANRRAIYEKNLRHRQESENATDNDAGEDDTP